MLFASKDFGSDDRRGLAVRPETRPERA
jgi:hypothetical protein